MRKETRKKLDDLTSAAHGRWLARGGIGVLAGIALVLVLQLSPPPQPGRQLNATMRAALIHVDPDTPRPIVDMRVELEDGRLVRISNGSGTTPPPGAKIVLTEYVTWDGRVR